MPLLTLHDASLLIQHTISFLGMLIILSGIIIALYNYIRFMTSNDPQYNLNVIRLNLSRVLILGLEFIVASDLIGTTTAPDYYSVGIVACIVLIRTVLSFTLNREIASLTKEQ